MMLQRSINESEVNDGGINLNIDINGSTILADMNIPKLKKMSKIKKN
jgi:hypothetical protein